LWTDANNYFKVEYSVLDATLKGGSPSLRGTWRDVPQKLNMWSHLTRMPLFCWESKFISKT